MELRGIIPPMTTPFPGDGELKLELLIISDYYRAHSGPVRILSF